MIPKHFELLELAFERFMDFKSISDDCLQLWSFLNCRPLIFTYLLLIVITCLHYITSLEVCSSIHPPLLWKSSAYPFLWVCLIISNVKLQSMGYLASRARVDSAKHSIHGQHCGKSAITNKKKNQSSVWVCGLLPIPAPQSYGGLTEAEGA